MGFTEAYAIAQELARPSNDAGPHGMVPNVLAHTQPACSEAGRFVKLGVRISHMDMTSARAWQESTDDDD